MQQTKVGNFVLTLGVAAAVLVGVSVLLQKGECTPDKGNTCLALSVAFDPPRRDEKVNIWVDIGGVRLITTNTKNSPWNYPIEIAPGTELTLTAEQIELKPVGVLDCKIEDGKSPPKYNYRTGNGQISCFYKS